MRLKLIEGDKPTRQPTVEDMPHCDENIVYIPLWYVYYIAERNNVSKKSAFWHILNHEILHIINGHHPYAIPNPTCWRDFEKKVRHHRSNELDAIPEPIDDEIRILNDDMEQRIDDDIQFWRENFRGRLLS